MTEGTIGQDCVVLAVTGEVDLMSRGRFTAALRAQPGASTRAVIVDLSGVPFCDAHGVGELVRLRQRARGIPVHLVVTTRNVRRCLQALDVPLPTHRDLAAALTAVDRHLE